MELLAVFFGWLLGVLSSPITDWWSRRRERNDLSAAFKAELEEVQQRLAWAGQHIAMARGDLQPDILRRYLRILERAELVDSHQAAALRLREVLREPQAVREERAKRQRDLHSNHPLVGLRLQQVATPFLTAHLHRVLVFDVGAQRALLHIHSQLTAYNDTVDEYRKLPEQEAREFNPSLPRLPALDHVVMSLADYTWSICHLIDKWQLGIHKMRMTPEEAEALAERYRGPKEQRPTAGTSADKRP